MTGALYVRASDHDVPATAVNNLPGQTVVTIQGTNFTSNICRQAWWALYVPCRVQRTPNPLGVFVRCRPCCVRACAALVYVSPFCCKGCQDGVDELAYQSAQW